LIRERLAALKGINSVDIFDDRAADATFITLIIDLTGSDPLVISNIRKALVHIPKIVPLVVNTQGKEMPMTSMSDEEVIRCAH
jgi:hypothetical protein